VSRIARTCTDPQTRVTRICARAYYT